MPRSSGQHWPPLKHCWSTVTRCRPHVGAPPGRCSIPVASIVFTYVPTMVSQSSRPIEGADARHLGQPRRRRRSASRTKKNSCLRIASRFCLTWDTDDAIGVTAPSAAETRFGSAPEAAVARPKRGPAYADRSPVTSRKKNCGWSPHGRVLPIHAGLATLSSAGFGPPRRRSLATVDQQRHR